MINAKDAHYLTNEKITRNKLKALNVVEVKIKNAIDDGKFSIFIDDMVLNNDCIEVLKDNGYTIEYFHSLYATRDGCSISW